MNGKVCKVIIYNGSTKNIVSNTLVKTLGLNTSQHPKPYRIGWIKKGTKVKLQKQCKSPFSVEKYYKNEATCDVIDMDACHILLGVNW